MSLLYISIPFILMYYFGYRQGSKPGNSDVDKMRIRYLLKALSETHSRLRRYEPKAKVRLPSWMRREYLVRKNIPEECMIDNYQHEIENVELGSWELTDERKN